LKANIVSRGKQPKIAAKCPQKRNLRPNRAQKLNFIPNGKCEAPAFPDPNGAYLRNLADPLLTPSVLGKLHQVDPATLLLLIHPRVS
jgi:hypothetical protein